MSASVFVLYGFEHILTLMILLACWIGIPFFFTKASKPAQDKMAIGLGAALIFHEINQVFNAFIIGLPWQEALPFHMCDMSALAIATYLLSGQRLFFLLAYFWGLGGAVMAVLQPDLAYGFPHPAFMPYFSGHGLIVLAVLYACAVMGARPYLKDVAWVIKISLILMVGIYILNIVLGEGANFWYLKRHPASDSLMNFFPTPPWHIGALIPLTVVVFYASYTPYVLLDWRQKKRAKKEV